MRQSYVREIKGLKLAQRFRGKAHSKKKVAKADRRMKTIAGRLVRELLRKLPSESAFRKRLELSLKFVKGEQMDGHKIYSLHEPDVLCISKGKEHKKYEFGNKVSILRLWNGIIVGALSFRNEYDGHTIDRSLEQTERIYGREIKIAAGDRGYRGEADVRGNEDCHSRGSKALGLSIRQGKETRIVQKAGGDRACHRALQGRPSFGQKLL